MKGPWFCLAVAALTPGLALHGLLWSRSRTRVTVLPSEITYACRNNAHDALPARAADPRAVRVGRGTTGK